MVRRDNMTVHHIGYAVSSIERSRKKFEALGYVVEGEICKDLHRNINILFMRSGETVIELISILDIEQKSSIDFIIKANNKVYGKGIPYHICYSVKSIDEAVQELRKVGFIETTPKEPAVAIDSKPVIFMFNREIGIIELVEE